MKEIVQIELTNHCTRKCAYCGQTNMTREKGYMAIETFKQCLLHLKLLNQKVVGLNHYGESLLHPKLTEILHLCNQDFVLPWLYTNGDKLDDRMIQKLSAFKFKHLIISGHIPKEKRLGLWQKCCEAKIPAFWQVDMEAQNVSNLAGQIDFPQAKDANLPPLADPITQCSFLTQEKHCVLWNGDIVACCFDYNGADVLGNVNDPELPQTRVVNICHKCPGHPSNIIK